MRARTRFNQNGGSLIDPAPWSLAQHISDGTSRDKSTVPPRWPLHHFGQIDPNRPKKSAASTVLASSESRTLIDRPKTAAQPLHKRIVLPFPNYVWRHYAVPAPSRAISSTFESDPEGSPQPQHRSEYRSLAVMRSAQTV
jgi:hypothetical protein